MLDTVISELEQKVPENDFLLFKESVATIEKQLGKTYTKDKVLRAWELWKRERGMLHMTKKNS